MKNSIIMIALGINTMICVVAYILNNLNFWIFMAVPVIIAILAIFYNIGIFDKHKGLDYQEKKRFYNNIIIKP